MKTNLDIDSEESMSSEVSKKGEDSPMDANESDSMSDSELKQPEKAKENLAWADAMAKILKTNKPKRKKTIVLSRAKRANQTKDSRIKEETLDFEIEGSENQVTYVNTDVVPRTEEGNIEDERIKRLKKKDWASKGHVKPNILEKDREKALLKIATRGVVQLFNAVREHQKTLQKDLEDAGPLEHKKDRVLKTLDKRAFLDVLMGSTKSQSVSNLVPKEIKEDPDNPTWSILRDDYMMSSKLKDWDRKEVKDDSD